MSDLNALRRVGAAEFCQLLNCGPTWLRKLERMGAIPTARIDRGGRRKWWTQREVEAAIARLNAEAVPASTRAATPAAANAATRERSRRRREARAE